MMKRFCVHFSIGSQVPFDDVAEIEDKSVMLYPHGQIIYQLYLELYSACPVNAKMFPFDHQVCNLTFASWTSDRYKVSILGKPRPSWPTWPDWLM